MFEACRSVFVTSELGGGGNVGGMRWRRITGFSPIWFSIKILVSDLQLLVGNAMRTSSAATVQLQHSKI